MNALSRVLVLTAFLVRELFRSLVGVLPVALALAFHRVFFLYHVQAEYFGSVGGVCMALVCLLTTVLIADRANKAHMYPLVARLGSRGELVAAVVTASFALSLLFSALFTLLLEIQTIITLTPAEALAILPRWPALLVLAIGIGLNGSRLVNRHGSNLVTYALIALSLAVYEKDPYPFPSAPEWMTQAFDVLIRPAFNTAVFQKDLFVAGRDLPAVGITLLYAALLIAIAVWLFRRKDLLWAE